MKTVSYKDPYEPIPVVVQIEDDDEEGFEKAIEFLSESTRLIENADSRERYHTPYRLEGLVYEGPEYASKKDEYDAAELDDEERIIVILSISVDTFFTRITIPKLQHPEIYNISVV